MSPPTEKRALAVPWKDDALLAVKFMYSEKDGWPRVDAMIEALYCKAELAGCRAEAGETD